eukprot:593073-Prymnesium_polylepis.2
MARVQLPRTMPRTVTLEREAPPFHLSITPGVPPVLFARRVIKEVGLRERHLCILAVLPPPPLHCNILAGLVRRRRRTVHAPSPAHFLGLALDQAWRIVNMQTFVPHAK